VVNVTNFLTVCVGTANEEFIVMFSANVYKWNKFGMKQERTLVVSNLNIYNFHRKSKSPQTLNITTEELRRTIKVKELEGLTKALNEKSSEFVIHVKNDYDYRMETAT
jgi:hypothetical protein